MRPRIQSLTKIYINKINKNVKPVVVSNSKLIEDCKKIIKSDIQLNEIEDKVNFSDFKENYLNIISLPIQENTILGRENIKYSSFIKNSIITCVKTEISSIASAIVTNPINKKMMYRSGFNFRGHTDFLASLSQNKKIPVMMMVTKEYTQIPITTHVT